MRADTVALRDALLAILRAADLPMTADQLTRGVAWKRDFFASSCALGCVGFRDSEDFRTIACHTGGHLVEYRRHSAELYQHLRAMERKGLIERVRFETNRVYWCARVTDPSAQLLHLEAMWSA